MPPLPPLPPIEVLSPLVTRVLGLNPGFKTLQGTNTYLVGSGPRAALIDTGEPDNESYIRNLREVIESRNLRVSWIILTHWHHDHVGGCRGVLNMLKELNVTSSDHHVTVYKVPDKMDAITSPGLAVTSLEDVQTLEVAEDVTLRLLHTPGHTEDSISVYLEQEGSLFSGDTILGGSSGIFNNYSSYMRSLSQLASLSPLLRIYPGHGAVEGSDVIARYIAHRAAREGLVLGALRSRGGRVGLRDLTEQVYEKDNLVPQLIPAARDIVVLMLEKLIADGHVIKLDKNMYRAV